MHTPKGLPERLFLVAVDPATGAPRCDRRALRYGVAAAALAELERAGRIAADSAGRVSVVTAAPTGQPVLDLALGLVGRSRRPARAWRWLRGRDARLVLDACAQDLAQRGVIRAERHRVLGLFPVSRYPAAPGDVQARLLADFHGAAKMGFPGPEDRDLASLAHAMRLGRALLPGSGPARDARRAMRDLARSRWPARAVARAVAADRADAAG